MHDDTLHTTLASLLKQPLASVTPIGKGRNSRALRVCCANGARYAAKVYHGSRADGLSRLAVEFQSLELLWHHGFRCVPQPIVADADGSIAVYEYIDGEEIDGRTIEAGEIDELLAFLGRLKDLARVVHPESVPVAHEACFSIEAMVRNIRAKFARLAGVGDGTLQAYLHGEFFPVLDNYAEAARASVGEDAFHAESPADLRTLSPADFGFHNALRRAGTGLVFLDFEYFGWEEPVKMMCDFLLHPAVPLRREIREYFAGRFLECFREDMHLTARFKAVYPLYALRWCMILLNEFLPEHLERRARASSAACDVSQLRVRQLAKARQMLQTAVGAHDGLVCVP